MNGCAGAAPFDDTHREQCCEERGILLMRLYMVNSRLPSQSMADSPQAHRIIVSVLACRSDVLLRERLGDSAFLSYAVWAGLWRRAIPVVGLAASHG